MLVKKNLMQIRLIIILWPLALQILDFLYLLCLMYKITFPIGGKTVILIECIDYFSCCVVVRISPGPYGRGEKIKISELRRKKLKKFNGIRVFQG